MPVAWAKQHTYIDKVNTASIIVKLVKLQIENCINVANRNMFCHGEYFCCSHCGDIEEC